MQLQENTLVTFHEENHTYTLPFGAELIGVTTLLRKHGLSPDYGSIPEDVLNKAAEEGTLIHKEIEAYDNGEAVFKSKLIQQYKELGLQFICNEYLVSDNEIVASFIDGVYEGSSENTVILVDYKTTQKEHTSSWRWQLSIYRTLFERQNPGIKVEALKVLWIDKKKAEIKKLIPIEPIPEEDVDELLEAEKNGVIYTVESIDFNALEIANIVEGFMSIGFGDSLRLLAEYQEKVKEVEESIANAKEAIYNEMLAKGVDKLEIDGIMLTVKKPYTTNKFDSTAFKKDHADLAEQYTKESEVKGSLIIKIK